MKRRAPMKLTGLSLIVASTCFWLAWLAMPGVGITDTATIFWLVGQSRASVSWSVGLQLVSAAAFAPALVGLLATELARRSRALRVGCALLALGAMGSAADAIFHLVALEMTAPGIDQAAMVPVMQRLQGPDLVVLMPFVLAFFGGHAVVAVALRNEGALARAAFRWIVATPVLVAIAGFAHVLTGRWLGLAVLAAPSGSLVLAGLALVRRRHHASSAVALS